MRFLSAVLSALLLASVFVASPSAAQASPAPKALDGITWVDLDGRSWSASSLEGKVVLLDFWATWCAPCLAEMPRLRKLEQRFADSGLVILGLALDTIDRRRLRSFLLRHDMTWPQVHEPQGTDSDSAKYFSVSAVPKTLVIDRAGRLVAKDLKGAALEATIEALLTF